MKPETFKRLRTELGLSQSALGKILGVSENLIYLMESGRSPRGKANAAFLFCIWFEKQMGYVPAITPLLEDFDSMHERLIVLIDGKREAMADIVKHAESRSLIG